MRMNYPVKERGGVKQQGFEAKKRVQRIWIQTFLKSAGINLKGMKRIVDPGCRNGDTTLGLLQALSSAGNRKARIIGVEEYMEALLIAKVKFGIASMEEEKEIEELLKELPNGWVGQFRNNVADALGVGTGILRQTVAGKVSFIQSLMENLPRALDREKADLIAGYQLLHWLDADETGLPKKEIVKAFYDSLISGGIFLSGTSTAFIQIDPDATIAGMTKAKYTLDGHPFLELVYKEIEKRVREKIGRVPEPVLEKPVLSTKLLVELVESVGFRVTTGAFLMTPLNQKDKVIEVLTEVAKLRPVHQGRLNGVPDGERTELIEEAIKVTKRRMDNVPSAEEIVESWNSNKWDAVPYIKAEKP